MPRRLTRLDELPRHQLGQTFDVVVDGSPHWSDGYYFTTGEDTGRWAWFSGFRLHPNNDVLDAFTCVSTGDGEGFGRQFNARWSRRLRPRIDDLDCGPVSVEIVEGLRTIRVSCDRNASGLAYDLTFDGWCPPYNEDHVQVFVNGRLASDRSNYDQCSLVHGWFEAGGERVEVEGWTGVRDHSWGIGNHTGGPRAAAIAPPLEAPAPPGLRQWCVFRLPDRAVFWQFHHPGGEGRPTKFESQCMYPYGDERQPFAYTDVHHDVVWRTGDDGRAIPRLERGEVHLTRPDGVVERYAVEPISYPVYLQGGGYFAGFDDGLGRGVYRGDFHEEHETWSIDRGIVIDEPKGVRLDRRHYAEAWGRCTNLDDPTDTGTGHLECVVLGPYPGVRS
ncbi:hypothetical protein [Desertimonas flava]|uniref:hypothetical protein n=1 Tax=Desertimonas flava TaxID=2064846 RepID=UPI0013C4DCCC|nr:hypothetical protein [Desertimonas flava]